MKLQLQYLTLSIFACISWATAQDNANVHGNVHIHTNGHLAFHGNLEVPTGGLLRNEAGTLYTRGDVTGEERIQKDPGSSLDVENGVYTFGHEDDEVFLNLLIGPTGIVEIPSGSSITVTGDFNNTNADTGIYLLADATGYAQLLTTGTVTNKGRMKAEQYMTSSANAGWRQLSSPVATTLADVDDDFQTFYQSNGSAAQWSVWWYDASPLTPGGGTNLPPTNSGAASATYWTAAVDNTEAFGPANHARAYNIYSGGIFDILDGGILDVSGAFGNGSYTFDCYQTHDKGPNYDGTIELNPAIITGWNLIPNPYPSNIDVSTLLADNTNFDLAYKAVHVWDAKTQQYTAITDDLANAIDWNTGSATANLIIAETNNIAPFQAFWVKAYDGNNGSANATADHDITLTNAHRTVEDNLNFFKTTPPVIALRTWDVAGQTKDQALLAFDAGYQNEVDVRDAFKLKSSNENVPTLATVLEGNKLSINRLGLPEPSHSIPLSFESRFDGAFYNMAMATADIDPSWTIYLEDRKLAKMINLRGGAVYEFLHDDGFKGNRFVVHINKNAGNIDPYSWDNISIYANAEGINVAFANPQSATAEIVISNLAGQLLYSGTVSTGTVFAYPIHDDVAMYVVNVVVGDKVVYEKIVK